MGGGINYEKGKEGKSQQRSHNADALKIKENYTRT